MDFRPDGRGAQIGLKADVETVKVRSNQGGTAPLSTLVRWRNESGPVLVQRARVPTLGPDACSVRKSNANKSPGTDSGA